jgi:hypothetical protein
VGFEPTRPFPATDLAGRRYHDGGSPIDNEILSEFETFCAVDLQLTKGTARGHVDQIKRFWNWLGERPITQNVIREYLIQRNEKPCTYANRLKSLKVFCRDFLKQPGLVESFKFPRFPYKSKAVPTKKELRQFYDSIERKRGRARAITISSIVTRDGRSVSSDL